MLTPEIQDEPKTDRELLVEWLVERGAHPADIERALQEADEGFHGDR